MWIGVGRFERDRVLSIAISGCEEHRFFRFCAGLDTPPTVTSTRVQYLPRADGRNRSWQQLTDNGTLMYLKRAHEHTTVQPIDRGPNFAVTVTRIQENPGVEGRLRAHRRPSARCSTDIMT